MGLLPSEARATVDSAIESKYKKVRKNALKLVARSVEKVNATRQVVMNLNAGVDDVHDENKVNHAEAFINAMMQELGKFPELPEHEGRVTHEILESISNFWVHVDTAFKEHGRKWYGVEYKSKLAFLESTMDGVLKHNAKLSEFIKGKYRDVTRAEEIKDKLSALENCGKIIESFKARLALLDEQAKNISEKIQNATLDTHRLKEHEIFAKREDILNESTKVKLQLQSKLGNIEKSLRMFGNALDNDRFTLHGLSHAEVAEYLDDLFANLIKDGPEHPRLNNILNNLLVYLDGGVQMKKDKKEKAIASIDAMRAGSSLKSAVQAYIDLHEKLAGMDLEITQMGIEQGIKDVGKEVYNLSNQQASLDAEITREMKNLAAARQNFVDVQREIEQDIEALTGRAVRVITEMPNPG